LLFSSKTNLFLPGLVELFLVAEVQLGVVYHMLEKDKFVGRKFPDVEVATDAIFCEVSIKLADGSIEKCWNYGLNLIEGEAHLSAAAKQRGDFVVDFLAVI
jgi:hypothetical protein